ncbi:hypothetical protein BGZ63DRAFT_388715 [Mariannaea sp. PMI_226]|nr:hypothetical protein BGZ63DRAFT_388715 [Mariannaea sp. PMI_226]
MSWLITILTFLSTVAAFEDFLACVLGELVGWALPGLRHFVPKAKPISSSCRSSLPPCPVSADHDCRWWSVVLCPYIEFSL